MKSRNVTENPSGTRLLPYTISYLTSPATKVTGTPFRNHLRSVHAIALINLGELTTGLALNCGIPSSGRAILVGISMEYLKKARGTLVADCRCEVPDVTKDSEIELTAQIRDASGDTVARARALWRVGPAPASTGNR